MPMGECLGWHKEFLPTLQPRRKWQHKAKNLEECDLAGTAKEIVASMKEAITDNTSKKNGNCTGYLGTDIQ